MAIEEKVPGTRFTLALEMGKDKEWEMLLKIGGATEEKMDLKNTSLREVSLCVSELLDTARANINEFQMEMISKKLYKEVSGDDDMSAHEQSMKNIENKKNMMQDESFQSSLVNEYRDQFRIKDDSPQKTAGKTQPKPKSIPEREQKQIDENTQRPEMRDMVNEINKNLASSRPAQTSTQNSSPKPSTDRKSQLRSPSADIDTRVSSVDIEDLVNELQRTKDLLAEDLKKVNKRMEKIDNIIAKLGTISSKL